MFIYNKFKGNLPAARSTSALLIRFLASFSFLLLFKFFELRLMTGVEVLLEVSCCVCLCTFSPSRNFLSVGSTNGLRFVNGTNRVEVPNTTLTTGTSIYTRLEKTLKM